MYQSSYFIIINRSHKFEKLVGAFPSSVKCKVLVAFVHLDTFSSYKEFEGNRALKKSTSVFLFTRHMFHIVPLI